MSSLNEIFEEITSIDFIKTPELSDTIVYHRFKGNDCYVNLSTKKTSDRFLDVVRKDKKYIVVNSTDNIQKDGYIAKYFPEHDFIGIAIYELEISNEGSFEWQQKYKVVISKHDYWYLRNDGDMIFGDAYMLIGLDYIIDMCGQFLHPEEKYIKKGSCVFGYNIHMTSRKEMRRLTGDAFSILGCQSSLDTTLCGLISAIDGDYIEYGIRENFMTGIEVDKLSLPEHVIDKIKQNFKNRFYKKMMSNSPYTNLCSYMQGICAGYLQNINGSYVFRTFSAYVSGSFDEKGELPIDIIEESRTNLASKGVYMSNINELCIPLIYFDRNIEEGPFKYCKKQLEKMERSYFDIDRDEKISMKTVSAMAFIPLIEKLYKFLEAKAEKDENAKCGLKRFTVITESCADNIYQSMFNCLGNIHYNEDELHKSLCISRALLDMLVYNGDTMFSEIKFIKSIFKNHPDYLSNMNKETAEKIIDAVLNFFAKSSYDFDSSSIINLFSKMIDIFGPKNTASYLDFVFKEYNNRHQMIDYMFYIDKLAVVKQAVPDLKADSWRVKLSELEKADEAISKSYDTLNDSNLYFGSLQKFKEHHREWVKYEYEDSSFIVTYPDGPTELIEEGTKLRHCVKDYIEAVATGKTTILFIRRKSVPKKPFYTLEVKSGHAIQCHGFGNCNVRECEGLMDFIQSFCDDKGIILEGKLDELIGPAR